MNSGRQASSEVVEGTCWIHVDKVYSGGCLVGGFGVKRMTA